MIPAIAAQLPTAVPVASAASEFIHHRHGGTCIEDNGAFCAGWVIDNIDRYVTPTLQHLVLVSVSVALGFLVAFGLALVSHRWRWLVAPVTGFTGVLYTIPSLAFFFL